jgi:hypothetical protein
VRNFSQPINPKWMRGGFFVKSKPDSPMCSEARLNRRERICALSWAEIPSQIQDVINDYQNDGSLFNLEGPEQYSNWAASTATLRAKHSDGVEVGGNWFFEDKHLVNGTVVALKEEEPKEPEPTTPKKPLEGYTTDELLAEITRRIHKTMGVE